MSIEVTWNLPSKGGDGSVVCDLGEIEHTCPRPDRGEVGDKLLISPEFVFALEMNGPQRAAGGATGSVTRLSDRVFYHLDYEGERSTWELFPAHWWDGKGPEILVGKWPD